MTIEDPLDLLARHFAARLELILIEEDIRQYGKRAHRYWRREAKRLRRLVDETAAELESLLDYP